MIYFGRVMTTAEHANDQRTIIKEYVPGSGKRNDKIGYCLKKNINNILQEHLSIDTGTG